MLTTSPLSSASDTKRVLFVLHQMGTLDHVYALHSQLDQAGAIVHVALGESGLGFPDWFVRELPEMVLVTDPLAAIAERRYDGVIMQMPYDELKDPVWSTIGRDEANVVYSGYSLMVTNWDKGNYGLPFHSRCSLVLASSPWSRDRYLASDFSPANSVWSGDPLMYEVVQSNLLPSSTPLIMWAPHWTETWVDGGPGFSTWKSSVHAILAAARRNPHAGFIVRGHPLLKTDGDDAVSRRASRAYDRLLRQANVQLSSESMSADILRSTALLTDGTSIIPYYCSTGKPLGITRRKGSWENFNPSGKALVNQSDSLSTLRGIRRWLDKACAGGLSNSPERKELVSHLFPLRPASPGRILLANLS
jgi:hypothetical protein